MVIWGKIKYYSVAYFNHVTEFNALLSINVELPLGGAHTHCVGGAHTHCVGVSGIYASMQYV